MTKAIQQSSRIKKDKEIIVTIKDRGTVKLAIDNKIDPRELMI